METTIATPKSNQTAPVDFLPLQGTDYVEFYVGNAKQAAHFYKTAFGFQSLAYSGPETGTRTAPAMSIRQNKLTFVLTTPLAAGQPDRRSHLQAWRWREGARAQGGGRDLRLERDDEARRQELHGADDAAGRERPRGHERDSHLRRHRPSLHRARRLQRRLHARLSQMGVELQSARYRAALCRSLRRATSAGTR